jgi:hypothetical protein
MRCAVLDLEEGSEIQYAKLICSKAINGFDCICCHSGFIGDLVLRGALEVVDLNFVYCC